jgi:hypothetical protein
MPQHHITSQAQEHSSGERGRGSAAGGEKILSVIILIPFQQEKAEKSECSIYTLR